MNKYFQNFISLILVILITLLILDYFHIIFFSKLIHDGMCFVTLALIIFSSTATICAKVSNFNKILNYLILISIFIGLLLFIVTGELNLIFYAGLAFTLFSSLLDMVYKQA